MRNGIKAFLKSSRGFTIVETVVAMVVGSVVIAGIGLFTVIAIRNFRDSRAETLAQTEAEVIMMSFKDKIKTIQDYKVYQDENYYALEMLCGEDESGVYKLHDCAFIYSPSRTDFYIYDAGENDELSIDFETLDPAVLRRTGLISTYMTDFTVSPEEIGLSVDRVVSVSFKVDVGRASGAQSFSIKMRNDEKKEEVEEDDSGE